MNRTINSLLGRVPTLAFLAVFAASCGGGGGGGYGGGGTQLPPLSFDPTFSAIQTNVFSPTCATAGCHVGANAQEGLMLDSSNSYALLVGVASSEVSTILRVAPSDPNNSYLIQKLEGTASVGVRMPEGRPALAQSTINIIRQWITDGAIDDRASSFGAIRVSSLSPVPGSILAAAPTQVLAGFDRELDATTVNAISFILEASGGDSTFGDGNEVQIVAASVTVPGANPLTAVLDLTGVALPDDTYRVRLLGSGPSIIMDLDANAVDGEFSGAFPSGDGTATGDFEATFAISTP